MRALRIRMVGKQDVNGNDYYFSTTHVPALIDLNKSVVHFYPDEEEDGTGFGGELVIRHYDPNIQASTVQGGQRLKRRRRKIVSKEPEDQDTGGFTDADLEG